jgi:hypothetical protein
MAKVQAVKPGLPPRPVEMTKIPFDPGGIYTEHGTAYFMGCGDEITAARNCYALFVFVNGKQVTSWLNVLRMSDYLNQTDRDFIYRGKAELMIPLEPWEFAY